MEKVTICTCASRSFINKDKTAQLAAVLEEAGYQVTLEADLCEQVIDKPADISGMVSGIIMACHSRVMCSHLHGLGLKCGKIIDIRTGDLNEVLAGMQIPCPDVLPGKEKYLHLINGFKTQEGTDAWYPVIDKEKCTDCGKCHDFCLFGVYSIENKKVIVSHPRNCKNNCPACARMCPSRAIIFPKYGKSPINGGLEEEERFDPQDMDKMYQERLRYRLQQRRAGIPLIKNSNS